MSKYVIVGSGQVGTQLAERLSAGGHEIAVVTRSGSGPSAPGIRRLAADAVDGAQLTEITRGADAIFNCANPKYHRWPIDWPPLASSMLAAAEATGAVLAITGNLYVYGPGDRPMTEDSPLVAPGTKGQVRVRMWEQALAAHQAGRARVVEVRASDYYGPGCRELAHFGSRFMPRLLAGKPAQYIGNPDLPHSATYVPDVVGALVTAAADERAWGRAWHVPTVAALTARQMADRVSVLAGTKPSGVKATSHWMLRAAGVFSPMMREMEEVRYQFVEPFELDSSAFEQTFAVAPTSLDQGLAETVKWWRVGAAPASRGRAGANAPSEAP